MVAPLKFEDDVPASSRTRQPHRTHRRFSARTDESYSLKRRQGVAQHRGQLYLQFCSHSETGAASRLIGNRFRDLWVRMPQNQRPPRTYVIKIGVAVHVPQLRARSAFGDQRRPADGAERTHWTIHTSHKHFAATFERQLRTFALPACCRFHDSILPKSRLAQ